MRSLAKPLNGAVRNRARPAEVLPRDASPHARTGSCLVRVDALETEPKELARSSPVQPTKNIHCDRCTRPVAVCVLEGYVGGVPVYHRLCAECDSRWIADVRQSRIAPEATWRSACATVLLVLGVFWGLAALLADHVVLRPKAGFGIWQQTGATLGMFMLVTGSLLRRDALSVAGLLALFLSVSADFVGPVGGFAGGKYQRLAGEFGVLLIAASLLIRVHLAWEGRKRTVKKELGLPRSRLDYGSLG